LAFFKFFGVLAWVLLGEMPLPMFGLLAATIEALSLLVSVSFISFILISSLFLRLIGLLLLLIGLLLFLLEPILLSLIDLLLREPNRLVLFVAALHHLHYLCHFLFNQK